ncbi:MAG: hypothetical protein M0R03_03430, partial [Novosphingobium sp.]|nr:hypothetical protein [Novosphingobium sp.]
AIFTIADIKPGEFIKIIFHNEAQTSKYSLEIPTMYAMEYITPVFKMSWHVNPLDELAEKTQYMTDINGHVYEDAISQNDILETVPQFAQLIPAHFWIEGSKHYFTTYRDVEKILKNNKISSINKKADPFTYTTKSDIDSNKEEFDGRAEEFHQEDKLTLDNDRNWNFNEPDWKNTIEFKNDNNIMHFDEPYKRPNTISSLKLNWQLFTLDIDDIQNYLFKIVEHSTFLDPDEIYYVSAWKKDLEDDENSTVWVKKYKGGKYGDDFTSTPLYWKIFKKVFKIASERNDVNSSLKLDWAIIPDIIERANKIFKEFVKRHNLNLEFTDHFYTSARYISYEEAYEIYHNNGKYIHSDAWVAGEYYKYILLKRSTPRGDIGEDLYCYSVEDTLIFLAFYHPSLKLDWQIQFSNPEFEQILKDNGISYYIENERLIINHKGYVYLPSLTQLPENIQFNNNGYVYLPSLTQLPENIQFNNEEDVLLRSLTQLPENIQFNNKGNVYLNSLTQLPENIIFNNEGDVYLRSLTQLPENKYEIFKNEGIVNYNRDENGWLGRFDPRIREGSLRLDWKERKKIGLERTSSLKIAEDLSFNKYDKERGQQLVNKEIDTGVLNPLDMQQSYHTDYFLPDLDHDKKEREALDWTGRENLQLGFSSLKMNWLLEEFQKGQKVKFKDGTPESVRTFSSEIDDEDITVDTQAIGIVQEDSTIEWDDVSVIFPDYKEVFLEIPLVCYKENLEKTQQKDSLRLNWNLVKIVSCPELPPKNNKVVYIIRHGGNRFEVMEGIVVDPPEGAAGIDDTRNILSTRVFEEAYTTAEEYALQHDIIYYRTGIDMEERGFTLE